MMCGRMCPPLLEHDKYLEVFFIFRFGNVLVLLSGHLSG
uniref:Uncharacterized protein n=1 Tax=Rhizophora mucronata TaxID=61149 RepID=A0A2P2JIE1_RHIMU